MKNTTAKKLGMSLFIIAVSAFVSLTFVGVISFSNSDISESSEAIDDRLAKNISAIPDTPPFIMVSRLNNTFDEYNQNIVKQKGISSDKSKALIENLNGDASNFTKAYIAEYLGDDSWASEKLTEYSGWMMDKKWERFSEFQLQLKKKISDVNKSAIEEFGLAKDRQKQAKLDLMLAGAPEYLRNGWWALLIFGLASLGGFLHFIPMGRKQAGIHNNHIYHRKSQTRMGPAIVVFVLLVGFYIVLYKFPAYMANQIALLDPLSSVMAGGMASQWFLYGFLYTLSMFVMGVRMWLKYKGNKYQRVRTVSVFFFQVAFAFTLPQILTRLQLPSYDIKSIWPLEYSFFFDYRVDQYLQEGTIGLFLFFWGIVLFAIGVPVLTYFYGKRWYCSWVCGCGGLAETVGDPYRHLSDKRLGAWQIERWLVHGVLVFAVVMTALTAYTAFSGEAEILGMNSYSVRSTYGFFIGFIFAGAVGTGFYPVMGNRVWCRFGCPLAAYLGLVQRFKSKFRITTNGGQCISCGNCSTYCEMGIDVRWYAQRGQNIVRSSCVGCGVCSAVCPRGVLNLENGKEEGRINDNPIIIGRERAELNL